MLSAIRAVAGNDDVKDAIVNAGGTDLIVLAISRHLGNPQVRTEGLAKSHRHWGWRLGLHCVMVLFFPYLSLFSASERLRSFVLQICEQGCAALCMLALRKPENCSVIMEGGGALAALQAMKTHPREVAVQVVPRSTG